MSAWLLQQSHVSCPAHSREATKQQRIEAYSWYLCRKRTVLALMEVCVDANKRCKRYILTEEGI